MAEQIDTKNKKIKNCNSLGLEETEADTSLAFLLTECQG